jgi:hypothetical protein
VCPICNLDKRNVKEKETHAGKELKGGTGQLSKKIEKPVRQVQAVVRSNTLAKKWRSKTLLHRSQKDVGAEKQQQKMAMQQQQQQQEMLVAHDDRLHTPMIGSVNVNPASPPISKVGIGGANTPGKLGTPGKLSGTPSKSRSVSRGSAAKKSRGGERGGGGEDRARESPTDAMEKIGWDFDEGQAGAGLDMFGDVGRDSPVRLPDIRG